MTDGDLIPCACRFDPYTGKAVEECPRHRNARKDAESQAYIAGWYRGIRASAIILVLMGASLYLIGVAVILVN